MSTEKYIIVREKINGGAPKPVFVNFPYTAEDFQELGGGSPGAPGRDGQTIPGQDGVDGLDSNIPGPRGEAGAVGTTGDAGQMGAWGQDGNDGESWPIPGPMGQQGQTGNQGQAGLAGIPGQNAPPGVDGQDGQDGWVIPSLQGVSGVNGINGQMGPPGIEYTSDDIWQIPGAAAPPVSLNAFGYAIGAGGTVVQATNKATTVVINKLCGTITMNAAALAAAAIVTFTVTNSQVGATDVIHVQHDTVGAIGGYTVMPNTSANGSFKISVRNNTAGSLSEAIVIRFLIIKGAVS